MLSLRVFDLPAKLTYAAYLVHPMIIRIYFFREDSLTHYSPANHLAYFAAFAAVSYVAAFVVALLIELPCVGLIKLLMPKPKPQPEPQVVQPVQGSIQGAVVPAGQ